MRKAAYALASAVMAVAKLRLVLRWVVRDLIPAVSIQTRVAKRAKCMFWAPIRARRIPIQQTPSEKIEWRATTLHFKMIVRAEWLVTLRSVLCAITVLEI